jgi:hypothetical protein
MKLPCGVACPGPPEWIGTGPRTIAPRLINQARWVVRFTQAFAAAVHGVPTTNPALPAGRRIAAT